MKINFLLLAIAATLSFFSCQKKDLEKLKNNELASEQLDEVATKQLKTGQTFAILNTNNSQEDVGIHHNLLCAFILGDQNFQTTESAPDAITAIHQYLDEELGFNQFQTYTDDNPDWFNGKGQTTSLADFEAKVTADYNNNLINSDVYTNLSSIIALFTAIEGQTSTHAQIQVVIDAVKTLENNVSNSTSISTADKDLIFSVSSVGKHSIAFWHEKTTNPSSGKYYTGSTSTSGGDIPTWAGADMAGAYTANMTGASSWGLAFGPWGWVAVTGGMAAFSSIMYTI